jgi:hypothetical protein
MATWGARRNRNDLDTSGESLGVTDVSVPIRRGRRRLEGSCPQYERTGTDGPLVCQLSRQRHCWLATFGKDKR